MPERSLFWEPPLGVPQRCLLDPPKYCRCRRQLFHRITGGRTFRMRKRWLRGRRLQPIELDLNRNEDDRIRAEAHRQKVGASSEVTGARLSRQCGQKRVTSIDGQHDLRIAPGGGVVHQAHCQVKAQGTGSMCSAHSGERGQPDTAGAQREQKLADILVRRR